MLFEPSLLFHNTPDHYTFAVDQGNEGCKSSFPDSFLDFEVQYGVVYDQHLRFIGTFKIQKSKLLSSFFNIILSRKVSAANYSS